MDKDFSFNKQVDDLVDFSQYDPELADGIKWLDELAQKEGVSFYDKVYDVLLRADANSKAKKWLNQKTKHGEC